MLPRPARLHSLSKRRARRRASPPNLLWGGSGEATCGKAPRPPVRARGAGQEGPLARGGAPGGGAQVAPATAPGPARLPPCSRSADNSASNRPQPKSFTPRPSHRGLGAAPATLRRLLPDCGEQAIAAAGHRSSDERGLREPGGAVGCYPVPSSGRTGLLCLPLRQQPRQKEAATTNLLSEIAYHVPPPWTGWPARGCYRDGRGSRCKPDSPNLAPERLLLSEGLIHPSRATHDNTKTNKTESLLQPAAVGAAPPCSCGHRKPGRGKETRWETSCGSWGDRVKQNYPEPTPRGKVGEVNSNPSSTASAVTLDFANSAFNPRSFGGLRDFGGLQTGKRRKEPSPSDGAQALPRRWRHWLRHKAPARLHPAGAGLLSAAGEAPPPGTEPGGSFAARTHLCPHSSLSRS